MKGELVMVPVVLQATDPEELSRLVVAERIKRSQIAAVAKYTAVYISRQNGTGYTKYTAFVDFMVEK